MINKICITCHKEFSSRYNKRKYCSKRCSKLGINNPNWKGDEVGYKGIHIWVSNVLGRPDRCSKCGVIGPVDLANISNEYKRDISDWEWLCRKCHMDKDGRMSTFLSHSNMNNKLPNKICPMCGNEFHPSNKKVIFCSQSCSAKHTNLFKRDYTKRLKQLK